jgi:hypothetical protein
MFYSTPSRKVYKRQFRLSTKFILTLAASFTEVLEFLSLLIIFLLSFLVWPILPTHCSCRGWFLHLTTLNNTHKFDRTPLDEGSARRNLYLITHNIHKGYPCPWWDSNPHSQQAIGHRPTPWNYGNSPVYICSFICPWTFVLEVIIVYTNNVAGQKDQNASILVTHFEDIKIFQDWRKGITP